MVNNDNRLEQVAQFFENTMTYYVGAGFKPALIFIAPIGLACCVDDNKQRISNFE
ncbi:MAG: hypothetical protein ISR96_02190 [Nitrospira sp.]|nr:hypothetical protein [bacterium]MBL7048327.1 hypothetical protein [Nitrospira sp.]